LLNNSGTAFEPRFHMSVFEWPDSEAITHCQRGLIFGELIHLN